ncbi:MAG TPA: hypothetical protein VIY48_14315 [Candidatus Paceibacterota bacterium]
MTKYYSLATRELLDNMVMPTYGENFRVLGVVLPGVAMSVVEIDDSDAPESYEGAMIIPTFKTETKNGKLKIYISDRQVLPDDHFVDQMSASVSKILEWVNEKHG